MNRKVLLNIILQPLRFLSILNMFMVHDLNVFQVSLRIKKTGFLIGRCLEWPKIDTVVHVIIFFTSEE
jgi:hypothetical protein